MSVSVSRCLGVSASRRLGVSASVPLLKSINNSADEKINHSKLNHRRGNTARVQKISKQLQKVNLKKRLSKLGLSMVLRKMKWS